MRNVIRIGLLSIFALILSYGTITYQVSYQALKIWFETLVPSMFCIMVLVYILFHQQVLYWLSKPFAYVLAPIFQVSPCAFQFVITSIFLGFPSGANFINQQVIQQQLCPSGAKRLIYTCSFATPGFVIMSCGAVLFQSSMLGLQLFLIQILSGLCLLLCTRGQYIDASIVPMHTQSITTCIVEAIRSSGKTLYMIGGYLLICTSIATVIVQFLPEAFQLPIRIITEFSSGTILLNTLTLSLKMKLIFCSMLLSFGGLCVHMQVMAMAKDCEVQYTNYIVFRLLQACLSGLLAFLIF